MLEVQFDSLRISRIEILEKTQRASAITEFIAGCMVTKNIALP